MAPLCRIGRGRSAVQRRIAHLCGVDLGFNCSGQRIVRSLRDVAGGLHRLAHCGHRPRRHRQAQTEGDEAQLLPAVAAHAGNLVAGPRIQQHGERLVARRGIQHTLVRLQHLPRLVRRSPLAGDSRDACLRRQRDKGLAHRCVSVGSCTGGTGGTGARRRCSCSVIPGHSSGGDPTRCWCGVRRVGCPAASKQSSQTRRSTH